MKFREAVTNFWYYHKWKVLVGLFVVLSVICLSVMTAGDRKPDYYAVVVTTAKFSDADKSIICEKLGEAAGDLNGDGECWAGCQFIVLPDLAGGAVDQQAYTVLQASLLSRRYELYLFSEDIVAGGKFDEFLSDSVSTAVGAEGKYLPLPSDAFSAACAKAGLHMTMRGSAADSQDTSQYDIAISVAKYFGLAGESEK